MTREYSAYYLAAQAIDALTSLGVEEWCVCPGARNAPLVLALRRRGARRHLHYDERAAGFFALGRIKATGRPVAVVTTSGTAAAELLPSMIEAYQSGLPLVAVTADRPRRLRGTGAPQVIEQQGLFGVYARHALDIEAGETLGPLTPLEAAPVHWNLCFDEPLTAEPPAGQPSGHGALTPVPDRVAPDLTEPRRRLVDFLRRTERPLVVVGPLPASDTDTVASFLARLGAPIVAEAPSGLRADPRLDGLALRCGTRALGAAGRIDGILRLGAVPCTRFWRDLEGRPELPVLSLSPTRFPGLSHGECFAGPVGATLDTLEATSRWPRGAKDRLLDADRLGAARLDECLRGEPTSEPALVRSLSALIPERDLLYLGNSLPVREWDLAARWTPRPPAEVNRGANGIDGQLSTFLGCARPGAGNWALLGDLTTLYDLGAPWALEQRPELRITLAVMNNGGGRIFTRMFREAEFENRHARGFAAWAAMWDLHYERWGAEVPAAWRAERSAVVELVPEDDATERFWNRYEAGWR